MRAATSFEPIASAELIATAAIFLLGLAARIAWTASFPLGLFGDPYTIVKLAEQIAKSPLARGSAGWDFLSPGLPVTLALILRLFPHASPEAVCRWATAGATSLLPLMPALFWRGGAVRLRWRLAAGIALAFWPGGIFQSHVVLQDTWVAVPVVALACLATGSLLRKDPGHPVIASFLWSLCIFYREDMLVACFPLFIAAAGLWARSPGWPRRLRRAGLVMAACMLAMAGLRREASGDFSILTRHGGYSLLGSYAPHASNVSWWVIPYDYLDVYEPGVAKDPRRMFAESTGLALVEYLRHPRVQTARMISSTVGSFLSSDQSNLLSHFSTEAAFPAAKLREAGKFARRAGPWLLLELRLVAALFAAAAIVGFARRNAAIGVIVLASALKLAIHAATVPSAYRYYYPVTALALLAIALAAAELDRSFDLRLAAGAFAAGVVLTAAAQAGANRLARYSRDHQERFPVTIWEAPTVKSVLRCESTNGTLLDWGRDTAVLRFSTPDPEPGQEATAVCDLIGGPPSIFELIGTPRALGLFKFSHDPAGAADPPILEIFDGESMSDRPDRVLQSVVIDGREVLRHDITASHGTSWSRLELPAVRNGERHRLAIRLTAGSPEKGWDWGGRSATQIRLRTKGAPATPGARQ